MVRYHIMFFISNMTCFIYFIEFSIVYDLFRIIAPITLNWILKLSNVSFWDILEVKKDIDPTVPLCISLWSRQMFQFSCVHHTLIKRHSRVHRHNPNNDFMLFFRKLIIFICQYGSYADIDKCILDVLNPLPLCQLSMFLWSLTWYQMRMLQFLLLSLILILNLILIFLLLTIKKKELHSTSTA